MFIGEDNVKVTHLEILEKRYDLDRDQQIQLDKERKGRIGEYYLKSLIETKLNPEISVISDYRFEVNVSECQIDFLILLNQSCIIDRKSTRLNSSHVSISYAVFCLKKKKK